jgi:hypothetical protein
MKSSKARAFLLGAAVLGAVGAGCGPAPVPERPAGAPFAIGPASTARPAPPPRPEAPPRAPDDLGLLVRVGDPEQVARDVVALLPSSAAAAVLDPTQLVTVLLGRKLGSLVDLSQPIDITSNADSAFVVSMAVKQDAEAKLGEGLVLHEDGGLLHIGKPDDPHADAGRMGACAFSSATGRATTRLVCASDEAALNASAAYLARNVAGEPLDADARLSVPGRILRDKRDVTARAIGDAASAKLGAALVERFLDEIDRVDLNVRFGGAGIELGLDLRLSARQSMLAKVLVPRTAATAPPRAFYRLPADALFALHTTGALAEDLAPLRKALGDNLEGTLVQDGYRADRTHELREKIESLVLTGGPLVVGAGVAGGRDGADKALAALDSSTAAERARTEAKARAALVPWVMLAMEEPAEKWTTGLRDIVRRGQEADKTRRPGSTSSTPHDPDGDHVDIRIGTLDPGLKLPRDALHVEVLIAPRTKGTRPTRTAHLFVVPKGTSTWLGYSEDLAAITSRLRLALDDATEAGTLSRSEEAASLRARPALGAGLVSLTGIGHLAAKATTADDLRRASRNASRAATLGAHGTPSLAWTASADPTPGSVHLSVVTEISRPTAADVLRMLGM